MGCTEQVIRDVNRTRFGYRGEPLALATLKLPSKRFGILVHSPLEYCERRMRVTTTRL